MSAPPAPGASAAMPVSSDALIELAREVLRIEAEAVLRLVDRLGDPFLRSVELILACRGRVVVSGIGKSGHIARKIASTLASTGTPAFFVHPAEANHGDLGMITADDVVIALSNSGEAAELVAILPILKRQGARLVAITGAPESTLARHADAHLNASVEKEACPLGLAPTASTTAALALGDALAIALLQARGFGAEDFARSHPGGKLGRRLLVRVQDVMHSGDRVPAVPLGTRVIDALLEMSVKGLGMTAIVDAQGSLQGIFTDGDLRRALASGVDFQRVAIDELMNRSPRTIAIDQLAAQAVRQMEDARINGVLVVDEDGQLVGALNMHDLLRAGVV
jgi:arabinose-5-phosphate isomerase